jgi:hypothetical protein
LFSEQTPQRYTEIPGSAGPEFLLPCTVVSYSKGIQETGFDWGRVRVPEFIGHSKLYKMLEWLIESLNFLVHTSVFNKTTCTLNIKLWIKGEVKKKSSPFF